LCALGVPDSIDLARAGLFAGPDPGGTRRGETAMLAFSMRSIRIIYMHNFMGKPREIKD